MQINKKVKSKTLPHVLLMLLLLIPTYSFSLTKVYNADDLCYENPISTGGFMCSLTNNMSRGICTGGWNCGVKFPLKNIGDSNLTDVVVDYNESNLGGSFGDNCKANPKGSCKVTNNIDIGPFGILGTATEFNLTEPIQPNIDNNESIESSAFISMKCFKADNLFGRYIKDGKYYIGKIKPCGSIGHHFTTGPFDAWDTFRNIHDRNISTKIVNQDFNLTLASLNSANDATKAKNGIDMQYQLYDMNNHTNITNWMEYNASNGKDGASTIKTFNVNSARKNVRVRFKFCGHNNGSGIVLSSLSGCPSSDINTSTFSSDNFAVRPFAFKIFGNNQYKRAGEDFNLTVKAVDKNNYNIATGTIYNISSVINYNEPTSHLKITSHFYTPSASDIHQMKTDTGQTNVTTCPYSGSFTVNNTNFFNGETNATLNFSETGILDINISEKAGYEFAKVDEDDTSNSQRYIKPAIKIYDQNDISKTNILLFVPYSFTTTAQYNTTNQKNWVYMADIKNSNISFTAPKMAAYVFYTIKAYNKFGNLTKNFTKTCFPDVSVNCPTVNGLKLNATFDLFLDLDINSTKDANITLYSETNTSTPIYTPNKNISILKGKNSLQEWISPKQFKSGVGQAKVYLNIDRNISTSLNPIIINVQDANTSTSWMANPGSPVAFNGIFLDTNKTFFYGRVHAPDYSAENNTTISDAKIYYEVYCKDCGKSQYPSLGKESVDGVYWYINTAQDNSKDGNISGFPNFLNTTPSGYLTITPKNTSSGVEDYVITYTGSSYPYKEDINISASKWFIYNPYNSNATTDNFYVDFLGIGGWAGIGNTGKTVDLNISTRRSKRLEW